MLSGQTFKASLTVGILLTAVSVGYSQQPNSAVPPPPAAPALAPAASQQPGERVVFVEMICVQVPKGFSERAGLTADDRAGPAAGKTAPGSTWALTQREAKMLDTLLRGESEKKVLSRPQIQALDGQTAFIQIGQPVELVTGLEAATQDGTTVYTPKKTKLDLGMTFQVTPKVSKDGKSISLRMSTYYRALAGTPVPLPVTASGQHDDSEEGVRLIAYLPCLGEPTETVQTVEGTVKVADGGTVVLGGIVVSPAPSDGKKPAELLWILTAHLVESGKQPACSCQGGPGAAKESAKSR